MVQVINETNAGGRLGSALGTGLSSGLQNLSHLKMQELQNRIASQQKSVEQQKLGSLYEQLGIRNPNLIAGLPEKERLAYLQGPGGVPQQQGGIESLMAALQQSQPQQEMAPQAEDQIRNILSSLGGEQGFNPILNALGAKNQKIQLPQQQKATIQDTSQPQAIGTKKPTVGIFGESKQAADERRHQENIAAKEKIQERNISAKEQREIDKETFPVYKEISGLGKAAKEDNNHRLKRIEELNEKGNLGIPAVNSLIKSASKGIFGFGIDLTHLMTADAQELDKLSYDFVKDAKQFFGNRLTDADLNTFLRTVPTLSQSKEGRKRVIENFRHFNEAASIRQETMNAIIKENGGKRPRHLEELIEERAGKRLDELSNKVRESLGESKDFIEQLLGYIPVVGQIALAGAGKG